MPIQKICFGLWSQEISGHRSREGLVGKALSTAMGMWIIAGHRAANQKSESVGLELLAFYNFQRPGRQGQTFAIPHHLLKVPQQCHHWKLGVQKTSLWGNT